LLKLDRYEKRASARRARAIAQIMARHVLKTVMSGESRARQT
jgi:hypothetical protein